MPEYIEREAAIESVREKLLICDALPDGIPKDASVFTLASMQHSLEALPAADVREVVLCRDCAHNGLLECPFVTIEKQQMVFVAHDPDFFCGYGEKRGADMRGEADGN